MPWLIKLNALGRTRKKVNIATGTTLLIRTDRFTLEAIAAIKANTNNTISGMALFRIAPEIMSISTPESLALGSIVCRSPFLFAKPSDSSTSFKKEAMTARFFSIKPWPLPVTQDVHEDRLACPSHCGIFTLLEAPITPLRLDTIFESYCKLPV